MIWGRPFKGTRLCWNGTPAGHRRPGHLIVSVASLPALVGRGACAGPPRRLPGSPTGMCELWSRAHPEVPLPSGIFPPQAQKGAAAPWERQTTWVPVQTLQVSVGSGELWGPLSGTLLRFAAVLPPTRAALLGGNCPVSSGPVTVAQKGDLGGSMRRKLPSALSWAKGMTSDKSTT